MKKIILMFIIMIVLIGSILVVINKKHSKFKIDIPEKQQESECEIKDTLEEIIEKARENHLTLDDITKELFLQLEGYEVEIPQDKSINGKKVIIENNSSKYELLIDENINISNFKEFEREGDVEFRIIQRNENILKILMIVTESENGIDKVEFGEDIIVYGNGKRKVARDFEIEYGKEYTVKIISKSGLEKEKRLQINKYYQNVIKNLDNGISIDNPTSFTEYNKPYKAKVTSDSGKIIKYLKVCMNGELIPVDNETGIIEIDNVTGDIEIIARFEKKVLNYYAENGNIVEFKAEFTGNYQIECWGAQGGGIYGGKGAYTCGTIKLNKGDLIYMYMGNRGEYLTTSQGSFNGGGYSSNTELPSGGGATDIRLIKGDTFDEERSLASRIMVAAGGAGGNIFSSGVGGTLSGKKGDSRFTGTVATQISAGINGFFGKAGINNGYPGAGGGYYGGGTCKYVSDTTEDLYIGAEGQGINLDGGTYYIKYGSGSRWNYGWFTGTVSLSNGVFGDPIVGVKKVGYIVGGSEFFMATGGSSYISGYEGCIAIKSETDVTPKVDNYSKFEDSVHYSGKYFTDTYMCAGDEVAENGESGNYGNGKVRITF